MPTNIIKHNFKSGLPLEFEILDVADLYKHSKELLTETHRTDFYHIIWFKKGKGTHLIDFKPHEIKNNSLLFVNKNKVQRFDLEGKYEATVLLFTDSFFCNSSHDARFLKETILFNDLFDNSQVHLDKNDSVLADLLTMMEAEWKNGSDHLQATLLKNMLHNFLLLAERSKRKQGFTEIKKGADLDYTLLFKDLLEIHFRKRKQVSYFAKEINVTEKLSGLGKALGEWAKQGITMKYNKIHKVLGEGNFVLVASEGHLAGKLNSFYDLFRVENGKIAEHWDVIEPIPSKENWKNNNGKF